MDWNDFAMWTAIAALIAGIAGIVGALIRDAITISGKIGTLDNTTLSGQHHQIQETIKQSSADMRAAVNQSAENLKTSLAGVNASIGNGNETLSFIQSQLLREQTIKEIRNKNMDTSQAEIKSSFDKLQGFVQNWQMVNAENARLREENKTLIAQTAELNVEKRQLTENVQKLTDQNKELRQDNIRLSQKHKSRPRGPERE
ncbi:hypothetical protein [Ethanoligenens sp.]|uniref:hypothetical protein n=1 Tax=Ethanoligenens sp. TaxID=2099655 RepID=UPI0039EA4150